MSLRNASRTAYSLAKIRFDVRAVKIDENQYIDNYVDYTKDNSIYCTDAMDNYTRDT
jgi:hypothetical protein